MLKGGDDLKLFDVDHQWDKQFLLLTFLHLGMLCRKENAQQRELWCLGVATTVGADLVLPSACDLLLHKQHATVHKSTTPTSGKFTNSM